MKATARILLRERQYVIAQAAADWYMRIKSNPDKIMNQACRDLGFDPSTLESWRKGRRPIPPPLMEKLFIETEDRRFLLTNAEKQRYLESGRSPVPSDQTWWPDLPQEEAEEGLANIVVPEEFLPVRSERPSTETVVETIIETPEEPQSVTTAEVDLVMGMLELIIRQMNQSPSLQTAIQSAETFGTMSASLANLLGLTTTPVAELTIAEQITKLAHELQILADLPGGDRKREKARASLATPAMKLFKAAQVLQLKFPEAFEDLLKQLNFATQIMRK